MPPSGENPMDGYAGRNRVDAQPTMMSAARAVLMPAPAAQPVTAAITGTGDVVSAWMNSWNDAAMAPTRSAGSVAAANAVTSPPVQKLLPAPCSRTAPMPVVSPERASTTSPSTAESSELPWAAEEIEQCSTRPVSWTAASAVMG